MHLHTRLSEDALQAKENNVMSCCEQAVKTGIKHIAFTEHRDLLGVKDSLNADIFESEKQCTEAKSVFDGKLNVMFGVELAHMHRCTQQAKNELEQHDFDFVIGSLHFIDGKIDPYFIDFENHTDAQLKEMYDVYVSELVEIAEKCDFDSLAHITYPLKYYRKAGKEDLVSLKGYSKQYDKILRTLIERQCALEINCSTYAQDNYNMPSPPYELVNRYIELGGKLFTIGSDSHDYRNVGFGVDKAQRFLLEQGIDKLCVFEKRNMYFIENKTE